jgi:Domain of unknown function (DUF397)
MRDVREGASAAAPPGADGARWAKSTHSGPTGGNCLEVALLADGRVAVRNSRRSAGPALVFPAAEWAAFIARARDGEFG